MAVEEKSRLSVCHHSRFNFTSWNWILIQQTVTMVAALHIFGCSNSDNPKASRSEGEKLGRVVLQENDASPGINFTHNEDGASEHFFPAIMAGGAAFLDLDEDNDLDIFLLNSKRSSATVETTTDSASSSMLLLQTETGRFADATTGSGLADLGFATGCAAGDVNNDGRIDLYVTAYGPDVLLLNQGSGKFLAITEAAGISNVRWSTSAAFLDFDRDGWLDLFVANYVDYDPGVDCVDPSGRRDFCNPAVFPRTSDRLYRNTTGDSPGSQEVRFTDVTQQSGIASEQGAGLGVITADFNGDCWIDIYVTNDGHGNHLWINQQNGKFENEAALKGVAYDAVGQGQGSMGVTSGDLNRDSIPDLVVANLDGESNAVYCSIGSGFLDNSLALGVEKSSFGMTGFGIALFDVDNDADLDLAIANGRVRRKSGRIKSTDSNERQSLHDKHLNRSFWQDYTEPSQLLLQEAGKFVVDTSARNALGNSSGVGRSLCPGDFNNDGRLDLLVTFLDRPPAIYVNSSEVKGNWLSVRLVEPQFGGRDAIGAHVALITANGRQERWLFGGGSYQCASEIRLHFGLGAEERFNAIEVTWPDGDRESFSGGQANRFLTLNHKSGTQE